MKDTLRANRGFTLVEMIVVMLIFVVVIGVTGDAFNRIVSMALSLTRTAETNISGIVGLELMRMDLEAAGFGLPWTFSQSISYQEAVNDPGQALNGNLLTYASDSSQDSVPRAVASLNNVVSGSPATVLSGTDVLAVRGQSLAADAASKRWTYVMSQVLPSVKPSPVPAVWTSENLAATDKVIVIQPIANMKASNQLVVNGSTWSAAFNNYSTIGKPPVYNDAEHKSDTFMIYGVSGDASLASLRMPFNRADYYVRRPASSAEGWVRLPGRCNSSSGILFKGAVTHSDGTYQEMPLLECVLDMQVVYGVLTPGSATITDTNDISSFTPKDVREQLKEIKVYILTHDGGRDRNYTYPNATIGVGPGNGIVSGSGRTYDFAANGVPDWQNYRWRVYQLVARPNNLAGFIAH